MVFSRWLQYTLYPSVLFRIEVGRFIQYSMEKSAQSVQYEKFITFELNIKFKTFENKNVYCLISIVLFVCLFWWLSNFVALEYWQLSSV